MKAALSSQARSERRTSSTRAEILEATQALLLAEGIAGVTIRKVSESCGYSAPTIYHHFTDKTGLIDAVLEERFHEAFQAMDAIRHGDDAALYLRTVAEAFVRFALDNPDHYRLLSTPRLGHTNAVPSAEAARNLVKQGLADLAREGSLATQDVDTAFQVTWAVLHGLISLHLSRPDFAFSQELVELAFDMVEAGLLRRPAAVQ